MHVLITLDRYDGSQGQSKEVDLESIRMSDLVWQMMQADVCGFTVTKVSSAAKLVRKLDELNNAT
ncbi:hypothetical protein phiK7A1_168 [Pseudomonas phage phiK7A1]|uniref:Uncharacterized protein n=1 Tax=Pseudomonas phage phiK7A1 TaxID=2759194 RepID=A0A7H0XG16_9CAUD|nr:hypothetical protein phiK7A1_168 [Pseudomonas phage phiK7A1]